MPTLPDQTKSPAAPVPTSRNGHGVATNTARTPAFARVSFGGIEFDNVTLPEAVDRIAELMAARRPSVVVTPNLDHVIRYQRDPEYAAIVQQAALVVADGQPIVWGSRWLGRPLKMRVAGSDLFPALCERAAQQGWRVFFLGGNPGAAEAARDKLSERFPGLQVVGVHCPPMGFEQDQTAIATSISAVRATKAELVFVGLGSPKQERWLAEHLSATGAIVGVGIGISFSFVAGHVRRAPRWMQRSGLEWFHRLLCEPRRLWRRYFMNGWRLFPILWRDWRATRRGMQRAR